MRPERIIGTSANMSLVIEGGQSFAEQCVVIKWLEDAGVDFFDISGGTYESPAWRGNIMKELMDRPSQENRGRLVTIPGSCFSSLADGVVQLFHRMGPRAEESTGEFLTSPYTESY